MEERIYIGGLNPPRLTAKEVAARLESVDGVEICSKDLVGGDKKFFYVNAISTDKISALDKISKQYNNVIWKQCKLVVQAARPHFLERLEQERQQREEQHQNDKEASLAARSHIPRHLKIRQKFGQQAHQVDTKPCRTDEWNDFCRVVSKLRTKRQQQQQHDAETQTTKRRHKSHVQEKNEALVAKKKAFLNRAVHLRWSEDMNSESSSSEPSLVEAVLDGRNESEDTSSSATEESDSDSDDSSESDSRPLENGKKSAYVWSDEEPDESSEDADHDNIIEEEGGLHSDESVSSESDSEEENEENDELLSKHLQQQQSQRASPVDETPARYEWSSDESSDNDEGPRRQTSSALEPDSLKETTEFSAAIDFDGDASSLKEDSQDEDSQSSDQRKSPADSQNLNDDVKANLSVLSSLFPDMAETRPVPLDNHKGEGEQDEGKSRAMQPGWENGPSSNGGPAMSDGLGLMQRFDPTKESAKKYILEPSKSSVEGEDPRETESLNVTREGSSDESESSDSSGDESESSDAPKSEEGDSKTAVYEQGKLEGIFRQARTSGGDKTFKMSSMFESKIPDGQAGSDKPFSFGFDVGSETTDAAKPAQQSSTGAFSSGFDLGPIKGEEGKERRGQDKTNVASASSQGGTNLAVQEAAVKESNQASSGIQRRGLFFPEETLDEYTREFLNMNEGARIREDPQGFLRDDAVKQQWKKERHSLTLDWKRKRKYAQSRMQKKMKFR